VINHKQKLKRHILTTAILIPCSIGLHLAGYYALWKRLDPFQYFFYNTAWWSYIIFLDALWAYKKNTYLVLNKKLPSLIVISCGFWCIFEIVNVRLENWFYITLPQETCLRYGGYLLAYGTVVPAIYVTQEYIASFISPIRIKSFTIPHYSIFSTLSGIFVLIVTLIYPLYAFPLTWIFFALILDGYNYRKGYGSFMKDLEKGHMENIISYMASGLVCGLLWEFWNLWSLSKWVYSVPLFEDLKIFEMPLPGYIGFVVFGIEVMTFVNFIRAVEMKKKIYWTLSFIALCFSLFSFPLIDRYTVFSYAPSIEKLSFINEEKRTQFMQQGITTSYGIDIRRLNHDEQALINLLHLKGLGYENFMKLQKAGIITIENLATLDETTLSSLLNEHNMRRVRVYLKAARKYIKKK